MTTMDPLGMYKQMNQNAMELPDNFMNMKKFTNLDGGHHHNMFETNIKNEQ
jgi:hypothetical protein